MEQNPKHKNNVLRRMGSWMRTSRRNMILIIAATVLLVAGIGAAFAASPLGLGLGGEQETPVDQTPANYFLVDREAYSDVLLLETPDAGAKYLTETLFVGDSNTLRLYMYGPADSPLTYNNVIGVESIGIVGARQNACIYFEGYNAPVTMAEAVKLLHPLRLIISLGTNDVAALSTEIFISNYREFIKELQVAYPYSDIIIAAVPPFAKKMEGSYGLKISKIGEYNVALVELAREMGLSFLDIGEALTGEDGYIKPPYIYSDGIHYTTDGVSAVLKYVRTHAHEFEDKRPRPLPATPSQYYVPHYQVGTGEGEEDDEKDKFDAEAVASSAVSMLVNYGFSKPGSDIDMTKDVTTLNYNLVVTENTATANEIAKEIYFFVLSESGAKSGYITITHTASGTRYVFTIRIKAIAHTHVYGEWKTRTAVSGCRPGLEYHVCDICGQEETREIASANPHTFDAWTVTKEAGCETEGSRTHTCTVCGKKETEVIPAKGHTWIAGAINQPDICQPGEQQYSCSVCGKTKTEALPPRHQDTDNGGDGYCDICGQAMPI